MDKQEIRRMIENKQAFVASLSGVLRELDAARSNVKSLALEVEPGLVPGTYNETIMIRYLSGGGRMIPATGNSNIENMLVIGRALKNE